MLATTLTVLLLLAPEGCVVAKELVHKPLGLVTVPNKYGVIPAGGMSNARNVCLRDPGILSSLPATRAYRADIMSSSYVIRKMYAAGASMLAFGDNSGAWQARWVTGSASTAITTTPAGLSAATFDVAQISVAKARERYFVTSLNDGVLALDSEGDTTVRAAGLPALNAACSTVATINAQGLADGKCVSYRFTWGRKFSDSYELIGEPSCPQLLTNSTGLTLDPLYYVNLPQDFVAGDFIGVWRTNQVAAGSSPGSRFLAVKTVYPDASNISSGNVVVKDTSNDDMLGEELYTNPGQFAATVNGVAATAVNMPPGLATDSWTYKNRTFYAVRRLTSYIKLLVPAKWGALSTDAERLTGVGTRTITGSTTNGSPTITSISASHMIGLAVGQRRLDSGANFTGAPSIIAVGATSITMSSNATATTPGATFVLTDMLEINGRSGDASGAAAVFGLFGYSGGPLCPVPVFATNPMLAVLRTEEEIGTTVTIAGVSTITPDTVSGVSFLVAQSRYGQGALTIRGTSAANYTPAIADIAATATNGTYDERLNRLQWSKDSRPEAVPPEQELFYGNGTHYRGIPTLDATWLFAGDGLWRMSGAGDTYRVDPVDSKLVLAGRNAVALLGQRIYAYTERGLVRISDGGIEEIARPVINNLIPGAAYADTWDTFVTADELHREIWLSFRSGGSTTSYVYSEVSGAFVDVVDSEWSAAEYAPYLRSMVVGVVSAQPDLYYFELDTGTTRMANADVRFQPFTLGDAFALKEWQDVNFIFEGVGSAMTLVPRFGATNYNARTVPVNAIESRCRVSVPRNAPALSARITPGFTFSAGGTTNLWSLRGISVSAIGAGDEVRR